MFWSHYSQTQVELIGLIYSGLLPQSGCDVIKTRMRNILLSKASESSQFLLSGVGS